MVVDEIIEIVTETAHAKFKMQQMNVKNRPNYL